MAVILVSHRGKEDMVADFLDFHHGKAAPDKEDPEDFHHGKAAPDKEDFHRGKAAPDKADNKHLHQHRPVTHRVIQALRLLELTRAA